MLDYEKQRQLVIVFILGVILVVIFSIVALVFIWLPEKEEEEVFEVGKVKSESFQEEDILIKYYNQIANMFLQEDTDKIYSLVGKDYLEYNKLTKEDVKKYLEDKGILGRKLELVTTRSYNVPGYSNVYYLDIKATNEVYSIGIVIREISPENYTIAFDKFIDFSKDIYSETVNSIEMQIFERVRYTNSVEFKFKLTNNYDKKVVINSNSLAHAILLVGAQSKAKQPIMTTLSTARIELQPGAYRPFSAVFNIDDTYDYWMYSTLVLKDVLYDGMEGTTNIEYSLTN